MGERAREKGEEELIDEETGRAGDNRGSSLRGKGRRLYRWVRELRRRENGLIGEETGHGRGNNSSGLRERGSGSEDG